MAKKWKLEWVLNKGTNRWQLNYKKNVGPVAEWIRECAPKIVDEWETFYLEKLGAMLEKRGIPRTPEEHLLDSGQKLYTKITEVLRAEINEVTEDMCTEYFRGLIIDRTFDGYMTEIETVYGQLQEKLDIRVSPAPDEWDRRYNVDFYIQVRESHIGLQIKPITYGHMPEDYKWMEWMRTTHKAFESKYGGKVFLVFSTTQGKKKRISNPEVVEEIKAEMARLK